MEKQLNKGMQGPQSLEYALYFSITLEFSQIYKRAYPRRD